MRFAVTDHEVEYEMVMDNFDKFSGTTVIMTSTVKQPIRHLDKIKNRILKIEETAGMCYSYPFVL